MAGVHRDRGHADAVAGNPRPSCQVFYIHKKAFLINDLRTFINEIKKTWINYITRLDQIPQRNKYKLSIV